MNQNEAYRLVLKIKTPYFTVFFGLPEPPGEVRNRSKIGSGGLLDVSWAVLGGLGSVLGASWRRGERNGPKTYMI